MSRLSSLLVTLRGLSLAHLLTLVGPVAMSAGALALLQGVFGGSRSSPFRADVVSYSHVAIVSGALVGVAALAVNQIRFGRPWPPSHLVRRGIVLPALLWAAMGWLLLMVIPAAVALSRNPYRDAIWLAWGLQDGRWLTATYLVTLISAVIGPALGWRWLNGSAPDEAPAGRDSGLRPSRVLCIVLFAGVVTYAIYGPPWNLRYGLGEVGNHDVHLSQLQSIDRGGLPYIGPASVQYGPGSQLLQYGYMKARGEFSMVSYRETYLAFMVVAFTIFIARSVSLLGFGYGTLAAFLALYVSPFAMFAWSGPVLNAFFGWANPFRYLGTFVIVASAPWLTARSRGWRNVPALLMGLAWGFFSWMSQENLATTIMAMGLYFATVWSLGACTFRQMAAVLVNGVAGLVLFWSPILAYYQSQSELARFVEGYFLIQGMVAAGMSNTSWDPVLSAPWSAAFYLTPFVLVGSAWLAVFDLSTRSFAVPLSPDRQKLLAISCAALICFTGAMFRKDSSHFVNVLIALPVVVAAVTAHAMRQPYGLRLAIPLALALYVWTYPTSSRMPHFAAEFVQQPAARFELARRGTPSPWDSRDGVAFRRAGDFVDGNYMLFLDSPKAEIILTELEQVRHIVGDRPVFVHSFPKLPPELVYFFSDLVPGPLLFNIWTMVFNTEVQGRLIDHMRAHCREFRAMVGTVESVEMQIFRQCHPNTRQVSRQSDGVPYFILLADSSAS